MGKVVEVLGLSVVPGVDAKLNSLETEEEVVKVVVACVEWLGRVCCVGDGLELV